MKLLIKFRWFTAIAATCVSLFCHAYPGESIVRDPVTGDYTITYWDDEEPGSLEQTTFVPATKIIPTIRSKFRLEGSNSVVYSYTLANGESAKQVIVDLILEPIGRITNERDLPSVTAPANEIENSIIANMSVLNSPKDWGGNIVRISGLSRAVWLAEDLEADGVRSGRTLHGFGFSSTALPGIGTSKMSGIGAVFGYAGDGPAMDSAIKDELERLRKNDFIARAAADPTIAVPAPFNAATLLGSIQTQMHTWIGMQLLDTTLSSQLDRYLTAAADAYRHNQPKAVKEDIEKIREMLKREHQDIDHDDDKGDVKAADKSKHIMIDRLAARVLDFDLQYVLKRMDKDHD